MRLSTVLTFLALCALALVVVACTGLTPDQQAEQIQLTARIAELSRLVESGMAAPDTYQELLAAILRQNELREASDGGIDWNAAVGAVGGAVLAYFGIEARRGPPTNRKGLPPQAQAAAG